MKALIIFAKIQHNFTAHFKGSTKELRDYYVGKMFNVGGSENPIFETCINVRFL